MEFLYDVMILILPSDGVKIEEQTVNKPDMRAF